MTASVISFQRPRSVTQLRTQFPKLSSLQRGRPGFKVRGDSGFLWRMNAYWRLEEADGGVFAECVSVTLSRGVPTGLGWLINPFIRDMPRESLEATLESTRGAVARSPGV